MSKYKNTFKLWIKMETVENRQCIGGGAVRPACSLALPLVTPEPGGGRIEISGVGLGCPPSGHWALLFWF